MIRGVIIGEDNARGVIGGDYVWDLRIGAEMMI